MVSAVRLCTLLLNTCRPALPETRNVENISAKVRLTLWSSTINKRHSQNDFAVMRKELPQSGSFTMLAFTCQNAVASRFDDVPTKTLPQPSSSPAAPHISHTGVVFRPVGAMMGLTIFCVELARLVESLSGVQSAYRPIHDASHQKVKHPADESRQTQRCSVRLSTQADEPWSEFLQAQKRLTGRRCITELELSFIASGLSSRTTVRNRITRSIFKARNVDRIRGIVEKKFYVKHHRKFRIHTQRSYTKWLFCYVSAVTTSKIRLRFDGRATEVIKVTVAVTHRRPLSR